MTTPTKSLGQIAFEGYRSRVYAPQETWVKLMDSQLAGWHAAAAAVREAVIEEQMLLDVPHVPQSAFTPELAAKIERELGMREMTPEERKASDQAVDEILRENNP